VDNVTILPGTDIFLVPIIPKGRETMSFLIRKIEMLEMPKIAMLSTMDAIKAESVLVYQSSKSSLKPIILVRNEVSQNPFIY